MPRLHLSLSIVAATALGLVACTAASGDVTGGEVRFDAAAPLTTADGGFALCLPAVPDGGADAGPREATWTALYADYFGGTATSGCGKTSGCHGAANQQGAVASDYVCPPTDKDACYAGITSSSAALIDTKTPETSLLYRVLRKVSAGSTANIMPRSPSCSFSDDDMRRITDWMKAGAKND